MSAERYAWADQALDLEVNGAVLVPGRPRGVDQPLRTGLPTESERLTRLG